MNPLACIMGDMDLVRPLGLAGIPCAVVARTGDPPRFSRFTRAALDWMDPWGQVEELVQALLRFGSAQPEPPVLFYQEDGHLLLVSRHRDRLKEVFRFVIPDLNLVEDLVDKSRFQVLAERLALPVPATRRLRPFDHSTPPDLDLAFPLIIKPLTRRNRDLAQLGSSGKALRVDTPDALCDLWPRLISGRLEVLAQQLIPGTEDNVESYHVYVDEHGDIAGEFTGRKIRTYPMEYGHSTAVETSNSLDVQAMGRDMVRRLGLRGVAKFDFKRGPDSKLYLLEINPRFNLWHHLGAAAGVNLPALVYADLVNRPRRAASRATAGVKWCAVWDDAKAAKAQGVSFFIWLPWMLRCATKSGMAWDDPMPFLRSKLLRRVSHLFNLVFHVGMLSRQVVNPRPEGTIGLNR